MNINRTFLNARILRELGRLLPEFPFEKERLRALQLRRLRTLLVHSYNRFEFYRERMGDCGLDPFNLEDVEELEKLPILTEAEYRHFADSEYEKNPSKYEDFYFDRTSGTTGIPFRIVRTWPERAYMVAKYLRTLVLNGLRWHDQAYRIMAPTRIPAKGDSFLQKLGILRRHLVPFTATIAEKYQGYQSCSPDFFYANKQDILETAYYILDNEISIRKPRIYSAVADVIEPNCRHLFFRAFGENNFFETYGSNELGNLAFQTRGSGAYHFCHDTDLLELVNGDGSINKDNGNCLITDFNIHSFPLIRFQLGDYLEMEESDGGPRKIKKIWGRLHDRLTWKDGSRTDLAAFLKTMEKFADQICQFQIIQEDVNTVRVNAVPAPGNIGERIPEEELKTKLVSSLRSEIKPDIDFQVDFVPLIRAGKNGKVKLIMSEVDQ